MTIYYEDESVTLYHGDCLTETAWLEADVLVTDPPYGRDWQQGGALYNVTRGHRDGNGGLRHEGIQNDRDTAARDLVANLWGTDRLAAMFGDPLIAPPVGAVQALIYHKPPDAGIRGARGGWRRDVEMVHLLGPWPSSIGGTTSVLTTGARVAGPRGLATTHGHPHTKPRDVIEKLLARMPGVVADPFAGSGSTLVAARNLGRKAIGVELEERYCEVIAKRLSQGVLDFGGAGS